MSTEEYQSQAFAGIGAGFFRCNESGDMEEIAEVVNIDGPGKSRGTIEVTHLKSPKRYREKISGFRDGGVVTLTLNFRKEVYQDLDEDFESDEPNKYEIKLPDDDETVVQFEALLTELPLSIPAEDRVTMDVSFEVTGQPIMDPD